MPDYLKILIPSAIGLFTTVCAAFLSARWAVRRAFEERWWERKEQAYAEIIDALYNLLRYASVKADHEARGGGWEHPMEKDFSSKYQDAYWKVQRMTDIGPFVISEQAAEILKKLRDRPWFCYEGHSPLDIREQETAYYREALDAIRECARKDLRI